VRDPSGHVLVLEHGDYTAEVVAVGAALRRLTHRGQDLVSGWTAGEICPDYRGWTLQPWPNRVGDGRYEFAGERHQLPLNEPERGNALHGLIGWVHWDVHHPDSTRAVLRHELVPRTGYPFVLELAVDYRLSDAGLAVSVAATNTGTRPAPYGSGHHPYLTLGRPADELELTLPAAAWCPMDDRGLPDAPQPVDDPFGDLDGGAVVLRDPESGRGITMTLGEGCRWVHAFSCDSHDPPRQAVAIEPMSCPPDAFRSGTDLVVLEPGETHRLRFTITGS
jgi:aldose 1-epimerase